MAPSIDSLNREANTIEREDSLLFEIGKTYKKERKKLIRILASSYRGGYEDTILALDKNFKKNSNDPNATHYLEYRTKEGVDEENKVGITLFQLIITTPVGKLDIDSLKEAGYIVDWPLDEYMMKTYSLERYCSNTCAMATILTMHQDKKTPLCALYREGRIAMLLVEKDAPRSVKALHQLQEKIEDSI